MKIAVILSSVRPGRVGERVAQWTMAAAKAMPEFEVELVDMADYDLPHFNEDESPRYNPNRKVQDIVGKFLAKLAEADGYVVVTPEYNHSIPSTLKNALDYLDFQIAKKPVAIVSYGSVGGARAAEHLKGVLIEAKAAVVPEAVALIGPKAILDEEGAFTGDASNPYGPQGALNHTLKELAWWTKTLKQGRESATEDRS